MPPALNAQQRSPNFEKWVSSVRPVFGGWSGKKWVSWSLARFGPQAQHWTRQVQAVGSDFHRAIGSVEQLTEKARAMGQRWLQGIGTARGLATSEAG